MGELYELQWGKGALTALQNDCVPIFYLYHYAIQEASQQSIYQQFRPNRPAG
jgi:hypothetical protein